MIRGTLALVSILLLAARDEVAVERLKEAPPVELAEPLRKELAGEGIRVSKGGKPRMDFWFRTSTPIGAPRKEAGVQYGVLKSGGLIGAMRLHAGISDFRAQKLAAGVYTLRYDVQPDDGDHLGLTETRDYLLLVAAADDVKPDALAEEDLHQASAKLNNRKHPGVLALTSPKGATFPGVVVDAAKTRKAVLEVEVPVSTGALL